MNINEKIQGVLNWFDTERFIEERDPEGIRLAAQEFNSMTNNDAKFNSIAQFSFLLWRDLLNDIASAIEQGDDIEDLVKIFDAIR